jgi:hypothetical protein
MVASNDADVPPKPRARLEPGVAFEVRPLERKWPTKMAVEFVPATPMVRITSSPSIRHGTFDMLTGTVCVCDAPSVTVLMSGEMMSVPDAPVDQIPPARTL